MAFPQMKKRFSLFSSPPLAPQILSNASSLLTTPQEIREDNKPTSDEIRKSFENLEKLVLTADEYRDCVNKLSKISKNFSKCLKDYGNCKGIDKSYVQCLQFIAQFYENHAEVQAKLYKALQKEFEILQRFWDKYSKKVAKDEKAHYEHVGDLDKQIKKINKDYEKKSKKESKASHEKYVASLTSISTDVARLRAEYAEEEMRREKHTHSVISQIICRFTEGQFASFNDSLKKCGPSITKVKEWTPFAGQDIPLPLDLDGFLEMQTMTLPESDDNNNNNNHNINKINNEPITSKKLPRRPSYRISQYLASISEMQKVAMRHKTAPSPTETPSIESNPSPIINDINEYENETITPAPPIVTAVAKSSNSVPNSKKKLSNDSHLTPNLLSSLSIGIHDNDNPFFRDGSNMIIKTGEKDSTKLEENHASSLSITKSNDKIVSLKKDQLKNEKNINGSDIDNENEFNKPNDKYYSNEYHVMDIERIANDSPAPSFETERLVRSFPIDLPVRSQPSTPTNSPSEKSSVFYNMKTDHLSGYIRDLDSIINSNTDHQGTHPYHDEIHVTSATTHLAKSYIDRTPQRQYNIQPRRAFTEYSSSDNDNKCGSSVADIRERLLSLNDNERKSTTSSTRDFPKPRQGYVNEVKTKFVGMGESNNNDTPPYSLITSNNYGDDDDMYPDQVEHFEDTNPASLSKPIINEQCDCHNCRELRKATIANDLTYHPQESFLHEDD